MGRWRRAFGLEEKEEVVVLADEKEDIEVLIEPDGNQKMTGHAEQHSALTRIQKDNVVKFAETEKDITELGKEVDRNTGDIDDIADYLGGIYFEVSLGKERWVFDTEAVPREGNFTAFSYNFDIYNTEFWINEIAAGTAETGFDKARPGDKMNIHSFSNPTTSYGDYVITSIVLDKNAVWIVTGDFVEGVGRLTAGQSYEIEIIHVTKQFNDDGVGGPIEHEYPYVKSNADTKIKPTADNRFITLINERPKEEDGSYADKEFGLEINIDEGNTWKNQFEVGNRHGFALKVMGGGGRNTWFGGKLTQKGDALENADARDYIIRKNLNDATHPLLEKIEHNEDLINALEHELEAIADTKESGEWELVATSDFDVRGSGQMTLSNDDFTASNNTMTLHETDKNGLSHGFSGVEQGDLVEVVEEHISKSTGDYGLYEVKAVNGMSFTLELQQGRGTAGENKNFFIKFFHLSDDVNIAELDARYAMKEHTHSSVPSHNHDYASSIHTHDYASVGHSHTGLQTITTSHGKSTFFGTNENWNNDVYHFCYARSNSGGLSFGGNVDKTARVMFKKTDFFGKIGKTGTLIASTKDDVHNPYVVMQIFHTEHMVKGGNGIEAPSGDNIQIFEGSVIYARTTIHWTNVAPQELFWYWVGDGR